VIQLDCVAKSRLRNTRESALENTFELSVGNQPQCSHEARGHNRDENPSGHVPAIVGKSDGGLGVETGNTVDHDDSLVFSPNGTSMDGGDLRCYRSESRHRGKERNQDNGRQDKEDQRDQHQDFLATREFQQGAMSIGASISCLRSEDISKGRAPRDCDRDSINEPSNGNNIKAIGHSFK
jgi:hypothetical protein